ncbi:MAG TPA: adenosylcobinamide-GDP ribazoletransferase [Steroidobacteraceae bacterium]|nr:adenosylcobinamide-GDP ribazoletransferase [Steroidobacteraceae bacterium]
MRQAAVWPRAALVALQFLTRLPLRIEPPPEAREIGLSLACYPVVGLVIGMLLWGAALALTVLRVPALLGAAILLALWVSMTGALHIDGLADTADAWVGGHGDRERTLAIMKDPRSGPVAVAVVNCLLLLKFAALAALATHLHAASLHAPAANSTPWSDWRLAAGWVLPPLLARAAIPLLFAHTSYVRAQGIAEQMTAHQSRAAGAFVVASTLLGTLAVYRTLGAVALVAAAIAYAIIRGGLVRRLGGFTGDGAGALIEVIETACAVTVAAAAAAGL